MRPLNYWEFLAMLKQHPEYGYFMHEPDETGTYTIDLPEVIRYPTDAEVKLRGERTARRMETLKAGNYDFSKAVDITPQERLTLISVTSNPQNLVSDKIIENSIPKTSWYYRDPQSGQFVYNCLLTATNGRYSSNQKFADNYENYGYREVSDDEPLQRGDLAQYYRRLTGKPFHMGVVTKEIPEEGWVNIKSSTGGSLMNPVREENKRYAAQDYRLTEYFRFFRPISQSPLSRIYPLRALNVGYLSK